MDQGQEVTLDTEAGGRGRFNTHTWAQPPPFLSPPLSTGWLLLQRPAEPAFVQQIERALVCVLIFYILPKYFILITKHFLAAEGPYFLTVIHTDPLLQCLFCDRLWRNQQSTVSQYFITFKKHSSLFKTATDCVVKKLQMCFDHSCIALQMYGIFRWCTCCRDRWAPGVL